MHLPQIEVVGAELAQRAIELVQDGTAGRVGDRTALARSEAALPGDLHLVTDAALGQDCAQHLLAGAVAVHRRGVEERATGLEERVEQLARGVAIDLRAPRHGAERESGDPEAGVTDPTLLHAHRLVSRR